MSQAIAESPREDLREAPETPTPVFPRPRRVTDLSDALATWLRKTRALTERAGSDALAGALDTLAQSRGAPRYRMVVVGQRNSGKRRLVNRLLGREVLSESLVASAARPVRLLATTDAETLRATTGDDTDVEPFDPATLRRWLEAEDDGGPRQVEAHLDSEWLRGLRAELIDTPGIDRPGGENAPETAELLAEADLAIVVVSALYPMGLAEARFLEQQVLGSQVPQVMVLVSRLDEVPAVEALDVFESIAEKVEALAPHLAVLPTETFEGRSSTEDPLEVVRNLVAERARRDHRSAWRSWRVAVRLVEILDRLAEAAEDALAEASAGRRDREAERRRRKMRLQQADRAWEDLRLGLGKRHSELGEKLRQQLESAREDLVERLAYDLGRTSDPKVWWERDLPYRLRQELGAANRKLESVLKREMLKDAQTLDRHIAQTFKQRPRRVLLAPELDEPTPELPAPRLADLEKYRLGARLGTGAGLVIGATLFSSLAGAVVAGGVLMGIAGESWLKFAQRTERARALDALHPVLDRVLESYQVQVSQRLRELYDRLIDDAMERRELWRKTQQERLSAPASPEDGTDDGPWRQILADAEELREEIGAVLESQHADAATNVEAGPND